MVERTSASGPVAPFRLPAIDEQLWPIACATMVLVGILGVIVWANFDFEEDRLYLNGYTYLAVLAVLAVALIFVASRLKGAARRTAELCHPAQPGLALGGRSGRLLSVHQFLERVAPLGRDL